MSEARLEIGHVLFIDIVGYSKLLTNEQRERLGELNRIVRETGQFRAAAAAGHLVRLPTGDGMVLAFFTSPDAPVRCAMAISRAVRGASHLPLRMGIHSGPVDHISDVNDRPNVAGAGVNMAQRVMDCGDAGHILLSQRSADDLAQYGEWKRQLHDLGEVEVKHGVKVGVVNLCDGEVGNAALPERVRRLRRVETLAIRRRIVAWSLGALALALALGAALWVQSHRTREGEVAANRIVDKSIAVLPFASLSKDEENAFFAGGVQDEVLAHLARIADLKVISRTSVAQYKAGAERNMREIGKSLGVAHVLEGSVQRAGGRVRVMAQLIDARTDAHLWAERYDRDLADVFAIQTEIAQQIANQLRAQLSFSEKNAIAHKPTQDLEAYDLYLRAKVLLNAADPQIDWRTDPGAREALALLEKAVARDPGFALAYCLLTDVNLKIYWTGGKQALYRARAEAALQKAVQLAPEAGETRVAQAAFYYYANLDYDRALGELENAARTLPNNVEVVSLSARIERRLGRWTEAARHFAKAAELDPRNLLARDGSCNTYIMMRQYREAISVADRAMVDFPEAASTFQFLKGDAALQAGDIKTARTVLDAIPDEDRTSVSGLFFWFTLAMFERNYDEARRAIAARLRLPARETLAPDAIFEGEVACAEGNMERATTAFIEARQGSEARLRDYPEASLYFAQAAAADAALGRREEAMSEIQKALELENDPLTVPLIRIEQAIVYSRLGDHERTLSQLEELAKIPLGIDYGSLRFDPAWDALRAHPRFQKILAELEPKNTD